MFGVQGLGLGFLGFRVCGVQGLGFFGFRVLGVLGLGVQGFTP